MPRNYSFADAEAKTASEKPRKMEIFTILSNGLHTEDPYLTKKQQYSIEENKWLAGEDCAFPAAQAANASTTSAPDTGLSRAVVAGSRWRQHLAALLAALSAVSVGYVDAWTANALPYLRGVKDIVNTTTTDSNQHFDSSFGPNASSNFTFSADAVIDIGEVIRGISAEEASWLSSLVPIGAMLGSIPAGMIADAFGRKKTLLVTAIPCLISWLIIIFFSHSVVFLYISRGISGIIMGVALVVVPLYNEEIAEVSVRGAIGVYQNLMVTVGILFCYIVGALVPYTWTAIIPCTVPIVMFFSFIWMPESPSYLFRKGREEDAQRITRWLRGRSRPDVEGEVQHSERVQEVAARGDSERQSLALQLAQTLLRIFLALTRRPSAYALWVVFLLMIFRQLTGIHAVVFYTVEIFEVAKSVVAAPVAAIIIGGVEVAATYMASVLVDKLGRRPLLLFSAFGATICHACLAFYYALLHSEYNLNDFTWLPLLFLSLFIVQYACGFGPLPWFMMAELTPSEHKNWASGMSGFLNWGSMFLVLKFFPIITSLHGEYVSFGIFAANCLTAGLFVYFMVPETKGKTLEEIREEVASGR